MIQFGNSPPDDAANQWRSQLDQWVQKNQTKLAAVAWGLRQEWGETQDTLGIDLNDDPHFVRCDYDAIAQLNEQVDHRIQEILGVIEHCDPTEEVVTIAIGKGQLKLIHFQPDPLPPQCFADSEFTLDQLIELLEEQLKPLVIKP